MPFSRELFFRPAGTGNLTAASNPFPNPGPGSNSFLMPFRRGIKRKFGKRGRTARRPRFMFGRKKNTTSGKGVTTQHDQRLIYRKKRMPSKRRRRWKRFTRKVNFVGEAALGTQTIVMNKTISPGNGTAGNHLVFSLGLYTATSSTNTIYNDLKTIADLHTSAGAIASATDLSNLGVTANVNSTADLLFQSGVMDVTFRNTSGASDGSLNSELTLEVDVYEIAMTRNAYDTAGGTIGRIEDVYTRGFGETRPTANVTANNMDIIQRGVTPFECPQAGAQYGVRIMKKTKYFVPNNGQFTYQVRDPGRHRLNIAKINEKPGFNWPGLTKNLLIIAKTLPGIVVATEKQERMSVGITRKYMYKIRGENSKRESYLANT